MMRGQKYIKFWKFSRGFEKGISLTQVRSIIG